LAQQSNKGAKMAKRHKQRRAHSATERIDSLLEQDRERNKNTARDSVCKDLKKAKQTLRIKLEHVMDLEQLAPLYLKPLEVVEALCVAVNNGERSDVRAQTTVLEQSLEFLADAIYEQLREQREQQQLAEQLLVEEEQNLAKAEQRLAEVLERAKTVRKEATQQVNEVRARFEQHNCEANNLRR